MNIVHTIAVSWLPAHRAAEHGRDCAASWNRELGSPFKRGGNFPGQIGRLCDDINTRHDAATGLPFMISALVHNGDTHMPGPEFFESVDRLELLPLDDDVLVKHAFMTTQLNAVFAHCQNQ